VYVFVPRPLLAINITQRQQIEAGRDINYCGFVLRFLRFISRGGIFFPPPRVQPVANQSAADLEMRGAFVYFQSYRRALAEL